jgi:hypothetical protein
VTAALPEGQGVSRRGRARADQDDFDYTDTPRDGVVDHSGTPRASGSADQDVTEPTPGLPARFLGRLKQSGLDLRNTWQVLAGAILIPLGVAAIVLAWNGAAHARVTQGQIPYLISGGLLGLGAIVVGCFFFWAQWLYRIYDQADAHHEELLRQQAELIQVLLERLASPPEGAAAGSSPTALRPGSGPGPSNGAAPGFVATPNGTNFHLPGCPIIATRTSSLRPVGPEEAARMRPCRVCEPLDVHPA